MSGRQRLYGAAGFGFLAVIAAFLYLQTRLASTSDPVPADEDAPPGASLPPPEDTQRSIPLWAAPPPAQTLSPQPFTNEDLHTFLEQDQKRLGIKKIYTKDELREQGAPPKLDPERAKQAEQEREKIRYMAEELRKMNELRKPHPIPIDGDKPALLSTPEDTYASAGSPTLPPPPEAETVDSTLGGRPPKMLEKPAQDEARVLRTQLDLDRLWDDMKSSRPKPHVDFEKKIVVAVVADRDSGRGIMIPRIQQTPKKVTVEYRDAFAGEDGTYYEIRVIDRTDAPVVFRKITPLAPEEP